MGLEEEVHAAITRRVRADYYGLGSDKEVGTLVRDLGLDEGVFKQWREAASVAADAEEAQEIVANTRRAGEGGGGARAAASEVPEIPDWGSTTGASCAPEPYAGAGAPGTGSLAMRFTSLYSR